MLRLLFIFSAALGTTFVASPGPAVAEESFTASRPVEVAQAERPGRNGRGERGKQQGDGGGSKKADCSGAGSKASAQTGGKVLSVSGGGGSCSVTVLVPGKDGGRPRKQTVTIRP